MEELTQEGQIQSGRRDDSTFSSLNMPGGGRSLKQLRKLIAKNIIRYHGIITKWDWEKPEPVFIDKIYTDLIWKKKSSEENQEVSFADMFAKNEENRLPPKWILLTGEPGTGKTTLMKRLLVDWSYTVRSGPFRKVKGLSKNSFEFLRKFEFVIPIFLVNIRENQSLIEVLSQQLYLNSPDANTFYKYINNHQDKCIFILDGYDEFKEETSEQVFNLANREYLKETTIIITSRKPAQFHLKRLDNILHPDKTYELKGFSESHVNEYVLKHCGETQSIFNHINSVDMREITHFPAMICLFCSLFGKDGTHSQTFTGIYRDVVLHACSRYQNKYILSDDMKSHDELLDFFKIELLEIGKLAVSGIADQYIHLSFTHAAVTEQLSEKALKLGLLMHNESSTMVSFMHESFQEYFIAYLICNTDASERESLLETLFKANAFPRHAGRIKRFIAGLSGDGMRSEIEQSLDNLTAEKSEFLMNYLLEHEDKSFPLPTHIHLDISETSNLKLLRSFLSMDSIHVKVIKVTTPTLAHAEILRGGTLQNLKSLEIRKNEAPTMQKSSVPSGTDSDQPQHGEADLKILTKVLTDFPLRQLTIANINDMGNSLFPHFCKDLKFKRHLKYLDLKGTCLSQEGMVTFWNSLKELTQLQCLRLPETASLVCEKGTEYIETICALKHLEVFESSPSIFHNSSFNAFTEHVTGLGAFRELILVNCGCSSEAMWAQLATNLQALKGIEYIDFSRNDLGKDFLSEMKSIADTLTDLRVLRLEHCKLTDSLAIIALLEVCESIQDLCLAHNAFGDDIKGLLGIKDKVLCLKHIDITGNPIGDETVSAFRQVESGVSSKIIYKEVDYIV